MSDRVEALESRVAKLEQEVAALRSRLAAQGEGGEPASSPAARRRRRAAADDPGPSSAAPEAVPDVSAAAATAPLAGRTLLVLAGAFVLRALTDAGTLPAAAGVALGFGYAGAVLALGVRAARPVDAGFHAVTAILIGFPLLLEATTRFQLLGPWTAGALLAALGAAALAVAWRRRLPWVAWAGTAAVLATGLGLVAATGRLGPMALALVAVGVLALWLGERAGWHAPRWPLAAAADLAVVVLAARAGAPSAVEGPGLAQACAAVLLVAYLGSFAVRARSPGHGLGSFEALQTAAALAAGLGGMAAVAARSGQGTTALALGAACLALSAAAYAAAFAVAARRPGGSAGVTYFASVALAFALAGAWLALPEAGRGLALGLMAVGAAALGQAAARRTLVLHAAVLAAAAAAAAGLLAEAVRALFSSGALAWPAPPGLAPAALACLVAAAVLAARAGGRVTPAQRAPLAALDAVVALSAAGVAAGRVVAALGPPGPEADLGLLSTGRTAVLAAGAALAAWLGRREAAREAGWLAWPILAVLGLKLVLQDFPRGRPATLILSLAFTGAALILVPRLRGRATPAATGPSEEATSDEAKRAG